MDVRMKNSNTIRSEGRQTAQKVICFFFVFSISDSVTKSWTTGKRAENCAVFAPDAAPHGFKALERSNTRESVDL